MMIAQNIVCDEPISKGISEETRSKLPSEDAIKKRAQRTRRKKNPRPTAPTCLADLQIDDDDCTSLAGDLMLQFDNNDEEKRIIILATARSLDILEESDSWYIDGTFNSCWTATTQEEEGLC